MLTYLATTSNSPEGCRFILEGTYRALVGSSGFPEGSRVFLEGYCKLPVCSGVILAGSRGFAEDSRESNFIKNADLGFLKIGPSHFPYEKCGFGVLKTPACRQAGFVTEFGHSPPLGYELSNFLFHPSIFTFLNTFSYTIFSAPAL